MSDEFDLVVIGSGGGGLSAALAAAAAGGTVCVLESDTVLGGTYAYSSGLLWLPANRSARDAGIEDAVGDARQHILTLGGGRVRPELLDAYLESGQDVLDFLDDEGVPFSWIPRYPDYFAELPGGRAEGRYLSSPLFDPAVLPAEWRPRAVQSPYYTQLPVSWQEIQEWGGYGTAGGWDADLLASRRRKGIRGFGGATTGYLIAACLRRGVDFRLASQAVGLETDGSGRVVGVHVEDGERSWIVRAGRGVLLASGGYEHDGALQAAFDEHAPAVPLTARGVTGRPIRCALALGAQFLNMGGQLLAPIYRPGDDSLNVAAREVALPGGVVVNQHGRRFCNDAFYWSLGVGMGRFDPTTSSYLNRRSFLVFDQRWKETYRLGPAAAGDVPSWLARGETVEELASTIGVPGATLNATLQRFNRGARDGVDDEFGRGGTAYARNSGDPMNEPNPCVRALEPGPLYALPLELGTMGTMSGLAVDEDGAVLTISGGRVPGLYACGNAMANAVEGRWYTSGTSNGRGLFFGVRAARAAMNAKPSRVSR